MLLAVLAALAVANAACAGVAGKAGSQHRRSWLVAAPAAAHEPPLLVAPQARLSLRARKLFQVQPASVPASELQPLELDSPLPFYAALMESALQPFLPPPQAADERRQALQRLAAQLAPAVDAALNETWEELEALLSAVEEMVPEGASAAGAWDGGGSGRGMPRYCVRTLLAFQCSTPAGNSLAVWAMSWHALAPGPVLQKLPPLRPALASGPPSAAR